MLAMKRLISDRRYITDGWQGHPVLGHLNNNITGEISQVPSALDWELIWSTVTAAKTAGVPGGNDSTIGIETRAPSQWVVLGLRYWYCVSAGSCSFLLWCNVCCSSALTCEPIFFTPFYFLPAHPWPLCRLMRPPTDIGK